jgi:hypothetical protein
VDRPFRSVATVRFSSWANAFGWADGAPGSVPGDLEAGERDAASGSDGVTLIVGGLPEVAPASSDE